MDSTVIKRFTFSAGHVLPNHKGKCSRLHGHNYVVEVAVAGDVVAKEGDSSEGMVLDFGDLTKAIGEVIGDWDHRFLLAGDEGECSKDQKDHGLFEMLMISAKLYPNHFVIVGKRTTAENLGQIIYEKVDEWLESYDRAVAHVRVWETESGSSTYEL